MLATKRGWRHETGPVPSLLCNKSTTTHAIFASIAYFFFFMHAKSFENVQSMSGEVPSDRAPPRLIFSHLFDRDHFPPLFCSKNRTFFFTTGSYFSIERGREARGRTIVRKKPVMAMLMRRTAMVRDFSMIGTLVSLWFQRLKFKV
jgi:hypothetical protein